MLVFHQKKKSHYVWNFVFGTSIIFLNVCNCYRSEDWNNPDGIKCAKETTPVLNTSTPLEVGTDRRLFVIASNVTKSMKVPVHFINITTLSEFRKDAHTSVYTIRQGKMLSPEQKADPATYADCIHWCLPGLPDTWNEFLYTRIIAKSWQVEVHNCYQFHSWFVSHFFFLSWRGVVNFTTSVICFSCNFM